MWYFNGVLTYFIQNPFNWYPESGRTGKPFKDKYYFKWITLKDLKERTEGRFKTEIYRGLTQSLTILSDIEAKMNAAGWKSTKLRNYLFSHF